MAYTPEEYKRWYEANRDRVREQQARYYQDNKDACDERAKEWRKAHPERAREIGKKSNAKHRDDYNETRRRYQQRPEVRARRAARQRERHAWLQAGDAPLKATGRAVVSFFLRQRGLCGICGKQLDPNRIELDHITPLARGGAHTATNLQAAHPLCNQQKGAL